MATSTDPRILEITIISGEDLRINGKLIKNNAYVAFEADSGSHDYSPSTRRVHTIGKSYPSWNEKLHMDLPFHSPFLVLEVRRRNSPFRFVGDCLVGKARIPVSDFVGNYTPESYLHFLSYRLRDANGVRNGIVNISVRVSRSSSSLTLPSSSQSEFGIPEDRKKEGAIVTGLPIWFPNSSRSNRRN